MRKKARYSSSQVAEYLGISQTAYCQLERRQDVMDVPYQVIEQLAALYHVEEYDILMGTAKTHAVCKTPQQEAEIIPFLNIVRNYLLMSRLLDGAERNSPRYEIAWNDDSTARFGANC